MGTRLLKRAFQALALHKCANDAQRIQARSGTHESFGLSLACRIAGEHPADGQRRRTKAILERRPAAPLHLSLALSVPEDLLFLPVRFWISQDLLQRRQARPHHLRLASTAALLERRGRLSENAVQAHRCDDAHPSQASVDSQFEDVVGAIAQHQDLAIRQPAMKQTDHLCCPHGNGFVPLAQAFTQRGRGGQHR